MRSQWILSRLFPRGLRGKTIVELGVGAAGGLIRYLKEDNTVFGLDASVAARQTCERMGLNIQIRNIDREPLPFESESIDIVFAMEVFEHFASPQYVIEEIYRILKPSGMLVISTPHTLIHHWPRLFYPDLFEPEAFKEFLMINNFGVNLQDGIGPRVYRDYYNGDDAIHWSWLWQCRKLTDGDAEKFLEHGLYFWNKKNSHGIRLRPMEAIDCFRRCYELEPGHLEARLMLARSLMYHYVQGGPAEFADHYNFLTRTMHSGRHPYNLLAQYHFAMMYIDFAKSGFPGISEKDFQSALAMLRQHPEGSDYLKRIVDHSSSKCNEM